MAVHGNKFHLQSSNLERINLPQKHKPKKGKYKNMNHILINSRLRVPLGGAVVLALFAALPARADYQSTVLAQNPAGYWRLNETSQPTTSPTAANLGSLGPSAAGSYNNFPTPGLSVRFAGSVAGVWYHLVLTYDGTTAILDMNCAIARSGTPLGYVGNVDAKSSTSQRARGVGWPLTATTSTSSDAIKGDGIWRSCLTTDLPLLVDDIPSGQGISI
jgi:hypothetical protein